MDIAQLRTEYKRATLDESQVDADAYRQFGRWFEDAISAKIPEPTAMTLATAGVDCRPAARIVLLKGFDARGFVFFTNYESRKGRELAVQPYAALLFHWVELERQVRMEGTIGMIDPVESDAYYATRPRLSQLGAWASPQSEPIAGRAALEALFTSVQQQYTNGTGEAVPRPSHWGGYRLVPEMFEFWQGRPSRMHDRIRYRRNIETGEWSIDRLAP